MSPTALLPTRQILNHKEIVRIPHPAGARVLCRSGSVWITQDGDTQDLVLGSNEEAQLTRPGDALIYAFEPSSVLIERQAKRLAPAAGVASADPSWVQAMALRWLAPLQAFGRWA